ncbi:hypothetical protein N7G274_010354 [Stereocaulon virgatum]|uniref:Rhodopsin domain-containing protein n=1 Tax=Stereocaulon virgatum TaxID=373712 RepID=A0ABR3ZTT3_9LECA
MPTSGSNALFTTNAIFIALAIAIVILRFHERRRLAAALLADDYLILLALFFAIALVVTNIVGGAIGGFGKSFSSLSEDELVLFLKILFVEQFWYITSVAVVKLSMLCLYGRMFPYNGRYPMTVRILIYLTLGWLISFFFATLFQVWPIWCNWTLCIPTTNYPAMYVCSSVFDILLDITILCIPVSIIKGLSMTKERKLGLIGVFGVGIFCIVASIARLVYTVILVEANVNADFASNFSGGVVNMIMWSGIEACASIVCATLPCLAHLRKHPRVKSILSSMRYSRSRSSRAGGASDSGMGSGLGAGNNMRLQRLSSLEKPIVGPHAEGPEANVRGEGAADGGYGYVRGSEMERGGIKVDYSVGIHENV